jgi:hypothetical protein
MRVSLFSGVFNAGNGTKLPFDWKMAMLRIIVIDQANLDKSEI